MTMRVKSVFLYLLIAVMSFGVGVLVTSIMVRPDVASRDITPLGASLLEKEIRAEPIDIFDIPHEAWTEYDIKQTRLSHNAHGETLYFDGMYHRNITYKNHAISNLKFPSVSGNKLGFYYYPNGDGITDIALAIMNISERTINEVYRESVRTSGWEWDGAKRVIVYYNGGTGVLYAYKIDIETGETVDEYFEYEASLVAPQQTD